MQLEISKNNSAPVIRPLISYFLQDYPHYEDNCECQDDFYSDDLMLNVTSDGLPCYLAARTPHPPTSCLTPGHTIKGGYTPSGKYKPASYSPQKLDKRAGK